MHGTTMPDTPRNRHGNLTEREREVCDRIVRGLRNREIAAELHISHRTVEVHRRRIFEKCGVHTAAALTRLILTSEPTHD